MLKKHIVIIGGGWAGVSLVRHLKHLAEHKLRVTLVSNEPNFRYSAAMYRVATGHNEHEAIIPIHDLVNDIPHIEFIKATATDIDPKNKSITLHGGKKLHYDYAILALGSVTSYFGIPGLAEKSYSIKSQKELRRFRTHIHQELLKNHDIDKNYIVVGAGPTGVELSAAMESYMKAVMKRHGIKHKRLNIELVEASHKVLPTSDPKASKAALKRLKKLGVKVMLNSKVEHESENSLVVNGRIIPTHTVVWTAGVANNPFFKRHSRIFSLNNSGKVLVDDHLKSFKNVYVIGDNAVTKYSGLGLTAVHNAEYVAKDLKRRIEGQDLTPAYKPLTPATVIPVGKNWAVFQYKGLVFSGKIASLIRSAADFISYKDISGYRHAASLWAHSDDLDESCNLCKSKLSQDNPTFSGSSEQY